MLVAKKTPLLVFRRGFRFWGMFALAIILTACPSFAAENPKDAPAKPDEAAPQPCVTGPSAEGPCIDPDKIPRFVVNSPFGSDSGAPVLKKEKQLWAHNRKYTDAPQFVVEKWLTDAPDMQGKYVLIEFWATWCPPCRRSLALLNEFHRKYGDELVVIGVCEENEESTRKLNEKHPDIPPIEFYSAIDTQKRMYDELGVWGIPHVIVVEPYKGCIIWEGFPLLENFELTDKKIERFLSIGRKLRASGATPIEWWKRQPKKEQAAAE